MVNHDGLPLGHPFEARILNDTLQDQTQIERDLHFRALLCLVKKLSVRDLVHEFMWCPLITIRRAAPV
jgi:hypothetical protein